MLSDEYYKRKLNQKPERYKLLLSGDAFLIADTIKEKYNENKSGYFFRPDYFNEGCNESEHHYNLYDLVDELNQLDFQINGELYDDYYHILSNKERIHQYICNQIDRILNNNQNETFNINIQDYNLNNTYYHNPTTDNINIQIKVSRKNNIPKASFTHDPSSIQEITTNNTIYNTIQIINNYLDEIENSNNYDDLIKQDTLIELKMRILEDYHKKRKLKGDLI